MSPRTVELGWPLLVTVWMATCRENGLFIGEFTSIFTPANVPVTPAVKVCAMKAQHSLILAPKLVGVVKDWSTTVCAIAGHAEAQCMENITPRKAKVVRVCFTLPPCLLRE